MHEMADQRRAAARVRDEALGSLSVTRDNELEITSTRQLRILEDAALRILSMRLDDPTLNDTATSMLAQVMTARRWTWVDVPVAAALTFIALLVGIGAAVAGGTCDNFVLTVIGGIVSNVLLGVVVLRHRRENWRVRAEHIAPMIWQHGV
jgi:hypothetical protein